MGGHYVEGEVVSFCSCIVDGLFVGLVWEREWMGANQVGVGCRIRNFRDVLGKVFLGGLISSI